jgi:hypothetical protein
VAAKARDEAIEYLLRVQNPDGSWASGAIDGILDVGYSIESFYDWQMASHALAVMALRRCPETAPRRAALEAALRWFCESRLPARGNDWDNDAIWAALYGLVAGLECHADERLAPDWGAALEARSRQFLALLERNQVPTGGFGYYDDPIYSRRPKWGTSFSTALVIPALLEARRLGWTTDPRTADRAIDYVARCRLPGGAYEYDLRPVPRITGGEHINRTKGSLGRIQVCNWALVQAGDPGVNLEDVRRGLELFFEQHRFLDVARMRPVPHEAYYANAGYFYFFGHYYAGQAINLLPREERESWHRLLRAQVLKTRRSDGAYCDFLAQPYLLVADTAYAALTYQLGLPGD